MKRQTGLTLIDLLIAIAILGVIGIVLALNLGLLPNALTPAELPVVDAPAYNATQMDELFSKPLSSLNATELQLLADYCMWQGDRTPSAEARARWAIRAAVYQNQFIIQGCQGR